MLNFSFFLLCLELILDHLNIADLRSVALTCTFLRDFVTNFIKVRYQLRIFSECEH
jgi:hypothetical protein